MSMSTDELLNVLHGHDQGEVPREDVVTAIRAWLGPETIPAAAFVELALYGASKDGRLKVGAGGAEDVLKHAKRLVQNGALNYSAQGCADCMIDAEACPTCYTAWWAKRHPHVVQVRPQSEALVLAVSALPDSETAGPEGTGEEQEWVKEIRRRIVALTPDATTEDA